MGICSNRLQQILRIYFTPEEPNTGSLWGFYTQIHLKTVI